MSKTNDYHRGERLRKFLDEHNIVKQEVIDQLGITKQRFYQIMHESNFNVKYIYEIAKITGIDPSTYFPDLKFNDEMVQRYIKGYAHPEQVTKLQANLIDIQNKYIIQTRELQELREELAEYKTAKDSKKEE